VESRLIRWHGLPLPMISLENASLSFYAGFQPTGFFGCNLHCKGEGLV
jgi:hypothetical protein